MNIGKNGGVFRWMAGILALAVLAVLSAGGGVVLNHETRITRVEAQVEIHLRSINESLQRIANRLSD